MNIDKQYHCNNNNELKKFFHDIVLFNFLETSVIDI